MNRLDKLMALLDDDPKDAFVLYGIAQEHASAGSHEEAVAFYDRCIAADPDHGYAHYHKARSLLELGRAEHAADTIRAGIDAARRAGDAKAVGELEDLLDVTE